VAIEPEQHQGHTTYFFHSNCHRVKVHSLRFGGVATSA
jgi:hypothetical protein